MKKWLLFTMLAAALTAAAQQPDRRQRSAAERQLRQQRFMERLDSMVASGDFQFLPVSMEWGPRGGSQIIKAETTGPLKEHRLTPRIADTAKALYIIYLGVSVACAISYHLAGMEWEDAIMHMMTTVSLSGIGTHDASFAYFNSPAVDAVAIVFMLISGFNFSLHFMVWRRRNFLIYLQDAEAKAWIATAALMSALTIIVLADAHVYETSAETVRHALFSVVSVITTTGYATVDYASWPLGLPVLLLVAAAFSTCAGSTGGGIKMVRLLIILGMIRREMTKLLYPKAVVPLTLNKTPIDEKVCIAVLAYFMVWLTSFVIGAAVLLLAGLPPGDAISAAWAMLSNIGPGLGGVGPTGNYADLSDIQLSVCSFLMLIGRLEIFTVFAIFTRNFWRI